ncbi:ACT domain-containing protein [Stetteria hydrogenophila]
MQPGPRNPWRWFTLNQSGGGGLSSLVRRLVDADPCVRECLARRLVNYSELARRLKPLVERSLGRPVSVEAVKTALVRYASRLEAGGERRPGRRLLRVLAESSLELRTGVTVATVGLHAFPRLSSVAAELAGRARILFLLQGVTSVTLVVDNESFDAIKGRVGAESFLQVQPDQAVLAVVSPPEVASTPGFVAYVTGILAENGVNISQIESVHTDTVLVLSLDDALKAFHLLREAIEYAREALRGQG